jgi:hypothetical protein
MIISKVISTIIKSGVNIVKVLRYGNTDVQTGSYVQPFGIDGNIPAGYRVIFADTGNMGTKIVLGIINTKALAQVGELRLHSEKTDGSEAFAILLKADGTCEIGGNTDNLVGFIKLKEAFNDLQTKFNTFAQAYTPGSPTSLGTPPICEQSNKNIDDCKLDNLKI